MHCSLGQRRRHRNEVSEAKESHVSTSMYQCDLGAFDRIILDKPMSAISGLGGKPASGEGRNDLQG